MSSNCPAWPETGRLAAQQRASKTASRAASSSVLHSGSSQVAGGTWAARPIRRARHPSRKPLRHDYRARSEQRNQRSPEKRESPHRPVERAIGRDQRRQELLSGIKEKKQFDTLRERLRAFPDLELETADYEEAAVAFSQCRERGVQGSNTDFLTCAAALRRDHAIFSTDGDFRHFARVLKLKLHDARS